MKKTTIFSSALVALAMLASCQKEEFFETPTTTTGVTEFTATIKQPTKTAIASDGKITWTAGDEIIVTDAASKSAVYVAASSGASTKFTPKDEKTTVGEGPYTATYGDISNQKYSEAGANCPLEAQSSTTNLHFSSPYAVVKVTAKSSGGELVKTVVVKYGNSSFILDCGDGVTLTSDGKVFYVAVLPSTEAVALSICFYTADKMATRTRKSGVSLAANDLLPVTFESLDWSAQKTFKAVLNTANTLTFYYDAVDHSDDGTVYEDNLFNISGKNGTQWEYHSNRSKIKSVVINPSVADYPFLTSTTFMFYNMTNVTAISGAEYLDVSNVTDMSYMFCAYGLKSTERINVPDVSKWNTGKVTDMSSMFSNYGKNSSGLTEVPNVKDWNTENVENMSSMFSYYGYTPTSFNEVPDVSGWNTGSVTNMSGMFQSYGYSSTVLNIVPNVSGWNTGKVNNMSNMFYAYGKQSKVLAAVPVVSDWNTDNVTTMTSMFRDYGYTSTALTAVPDVSGWKTGKVTNMGYLFGEYGYTSTSLNAVPDVSKWDTGKVTDWGEIFRNYGYTSTALNTVPDVSGWKTGSVTDIASMFDGYGSTSSNIDCVLDLSGWDLSNVETESKAFDFHPKTFNVTIPAKTGNKVNEAGKWYCGSNSDIQTSKSIVPASESYFIPVLPGEFSVSANKKVHFSKGNLWYGPATTDATPTFNFETNQYDISSSWTSSHVSNFYWSQTDSKAYSETYSDTGATTDVLFTNATETTPKAGFTVNSNAGVWRTLSRTEWQYLLANHTYKYLSVNGRYGIVIAPDGFSGEIKESYDATTWATAETAGLVFLPSTGFRENSYISEVSGDTISCIYWTSTAVPDKQENAYRMFFQWIDSKLSTNFDTDGLREWAVGIRLVTDCQ